MTEPPAESRKPQAERRRDAAVLPPAPRSRFSTADGSSPPRLVFRFALYTAIGVSIAGAGILMFVRHHGIVQAEQAVTFHTTFVAASILPDRLSAADFQAPVGTGRRKALDSVFGRQVLVGGTLRATLYGRDGTVTYSTDRRLIGTTAKDYGRVRQALAGGVVSKVTMLTDKREGDTKVLAGYVPLRLRPGKPAGVLALDQDYAPIAQAAQKAFLPVAGVLEVMLIGLYVALFPVLRRVTKRLGRQLQEIEHQALHDGLTGLPNRELFRMRVEEALVASKQRGLGAAVLLLDLDRFKEINDTLGHESGDRLLQALAQRLRSVIRVSDTVARLGGDEFAVVSPGAGDETSALALAERVRTKLERPFTIGGLTLEVEASIGIALFPQHGEDVEALIRHADVAMYVGKETHRSNLYAVEDDHYSPDRLALVGELRRAIEQRELIVHYQPRVEVATGAVAKAEALVRWQHPERGLLAPGEFVPLAEHTGLIRPLTRYVLDAALRSCGAWTTEGFRTGVSVNLSGRDLLDLDLPIEVGKLLARWRVEPARLELEITENTILSDPSRAQAVLTRLRDLGVTLAIDDFGTGFSSLGQLRRLPVDVLKIDKSFVLNMADDENDAVIVRSTIELGHNLGLKVVAEGVESQEIWDQLVELGCDTAQGYFLSRPVAELELREWVRSRSSTAEAA